jgi:dihydroxyacid dehydratase/phosphogluconate dehydratase
MEEIYQLTSALTYAPWGQSVSIVTDARFSGVSTGACIGHVGPEALAGGPIGRLRDGDLVEIRIDRRNLTGEINLVGIRDHDRGGERDRVLDPDEAARVLAARTPHAGLRTAERLPDDTRLWAALQQASGGTWGGCVYDVERIIAILNAGLAGAGQGRSEP